MLWHPVLVLSGSFLRKDLPWEINRCRENFVSKDNRRDLGMKRAMDPKRNMLESFPVISGRNTAFISGCFSCRFRRETDGTSEEDAGKTMAPVVSFEDPVTGNLVLGTLVLACTWQATLKMTQKRSDPTCFVKAMTQLEILLEQPVPLRFTLSVGSINILGDSTGNMLHSGYPQYATNSMTDGTVSRFLHVAISSHKHKRRLMVTTVTSLKSRMLLDNTTSWKFCVNAFILLWAWILETRQCGPGFQSSGHLEESLALVWFNQQDRKSIHTQRTHLIHLIRSQWKKILLLWLSCLSSRTAENIPQSVSHIYLSEIRFWMQSYFFDRNNVMREWWL